MANNQETKPLLGADLEGGNNSARSDSYGVETTEHEHNIQSASFTESSWWEENKAKIPGYGMYTLFKQVQGLT